MTSSGVDGSLLFHLTKDLNTLASIVRDGRLRAINAYGAARNHARLRDSQRVVCLSEISLEDRERLADRHGEFGVAFRTAWARQHGAGPIWYLSRGTDPQQRIFDLIGNLAFRKPPESGDPLWRLTPFIDYPGEHDRGGTSTRYDWSWEREWRVVGDLAFAPDDVAVVFAPEAAHDTVREMWLWEALDADRGNMPPLIDVRWPLRVQVDVVIAGPSAIESDVRDWYELEIDPGIDPEPHVDTAPESLTWVEEEELHAREMREELSGYWDEYSRDD